MGVTYHGARGAAARYFALCFSPILVQGPRAAPVPPFSIRCSFLRSLQTLDLFLVFFVVSSKGKTVFFSDILLCLYVW